MGKGTSSDLVMLGLTASNIYPSFHPPSFESFIITHGSSVTQTPALINGPLTVFHSLYCDDQVRLISFDGLTGARSLSPTWWATVSAVTHKLPPSLSLSLSLSRDTRIYIYIYWKNKWQWNGNETDAFSSGIQSTVRFSNDGYSLATYCEFPIVL